jgi:hypothetical protein
MNAVSRLRSGTWNYDEDVLDGFLVFEGVDHISFEPPGRIPNDEISEIEFLGYDGDRFTVLLEIGSGYELGNYVNVKTTPAELIDGDVSVLIYPLAALLYLVLGPHYFAFILSYIGLELLMMKRIMVAPPLIQSGS